jgi:hypothetical protein
VAHQVDVWKLFKLAVSRTGDGHWMKTGRAFAAFGSVILVDFAMNFFGPLDKLGRGYSAGKTALDIAAFPTPSAGQVIIGRLLELAVVGTADFHFFKCAFVYNCVVTITVVSVNFAGALDEIFKRQLSHISAHLTTKMKGVQEKIAARLYSR